MTIVLRRQFLGVLLLLAALFPTTAPGWRGRTSGSNAAAGQAAGEYRLLIASLNMHGELNVERVRSEFARHVKLQRADILLLQEVEGDPKKCNKLVNGLAGSLGLPFVHMPDETQETENGDGLATISRYRLKETVVMPLKRFDLVIRSRRRIALAETVETPAGEIRLFNLHLDSRVNPEQRLDQLSAVLAAANSESRPVVIGGDFNTGDYHWVSHVLPIPDKRSQRDALLKKMAESGFSTPFESAGPTHDQLGLQLDWIFFRQLRAFAAGTQPIDFSDHHAIWAEIGHQTSAS